MASLSAASAKPNERLLHQLLDLCHHLQPVLEHCNPRKAQQRIVTAGTVGNTNETTVTAVLYPYHHPPPSMTTTPTTATDMTEIAFSKPYTAG